jgi:hypothetical protein
MLFETFTTTTTTTTTTTQIFSENRNKKNVDVFVLNKNNTRRALIVYFHNWIISFYIIANIKNKKSQSIK